MSLGDKFGQQKVRKRKMLGMKKWEKWLESLFVTLAVAGATCGVLIIGLIGTSVGMRYFAYAPLRYTEELVGLLMTAAFSLVLPLITLRSKHVRVLMVLTCLPKPQKRVFNILAGVLGLVFCMWFFLLCLPWVEFALDRKIKTEVGRILMYPWMVLMPLSFLLTGLAFFLRGLFLFKKET